MQVQVLRGENQIGGTILKVVTETTRLILDVGSELESSSPPRVPKIEGLFRGEPAYDGVLISHNYLDHTGLIPYIVSGIPVYMSRRMEQFYRFTAAVQRMNALTDPVIFDADGQVANGSFSFMIGDIRITPYQCYGGMYESFMFLLESGGEKLLYTGGFRNDGRPDPMGMIEALPKVDKLVIEATMLSRLFGGVAGGEEAIAGAIYNVLQAPGPVFFMSSSTNIGRLESLQYAAAAAGRTLVTDQYQYELLKAERPDLADFAAHPELRLFSYTDSQDRNGTQMQEEHFISMEMIAFKHFVMTLRAGRTTERFLTDFTSYHPLQGAVLIASMWKGFLEQKDVRRFVDFCRSLGMNVIFIHRDGMEDLTALKRLTDRVAPAQIFPIHASDPEKLVQILRS